jgi:thiol:disulfide interchange protein DsbD
LALAFKFLSNADLVEGWGILKREVFIAVWIVIFLSLSFYLFKSQANKINYKNIFGWIFLFFSLYLSSGLINSKNVRFLSGILPPEFYSIESKSSDCPLGLNCFKDYDEGKTFAIENEKIILLDFTGWACANCRRMEENVWSKPTIYNLLDNNFIIISLYVDDRSTLSQDQAFKYLNQSGNIQYINSVGEDGLFFSRLILIMHLNLIMLQCFHQEKFYLNLYNTLQKIILKIGLNHLLRNQRSDLFFNIHFFKRNSKSITVNSFF